LGVDRRVVENPRVVQVVGLYQAHEDEVPSAAGDELIFDFLADGGKLPRFEAPLIGSIARERQALRDDDERDEEAEVPARAGQGA
jgi:hypothetical protein